MEAVPMGPLVSTGGGGHYQFMPMFTKDGEHTFVVASQGSRVQGYLEGIAGPLVTGVPTLTGNWGARSPAFSADEQSMGYVASMDNGKSVVVVNGTASPVYDGVQWFSFGPAGHHFAYAVRKGERDRTGFFMVEDGKAGLIYQSVNPDLAVFSPDGEHFAYVGVAAADAKQSTPLAVQAAGGRVPQRARVVLDGVEESLHFENIMRPMFSKDGKHLAYIAGVDGFTPTRVVVDGKVGRTYAKVEKLAISDDGSRVAYAVQRQTNQGIPQGFVVDNGAEGQPVSAITEVVVSRDGRRMAYGALTTTGQSYVAENGTPGRQYQTCQGVNFTPDSQTLLYTVRATAGQFIVANGREIGPFGQINNVMAFSEDGKHWACWVEKNGGGYEVVEDGREIPFNPGVGPGDLKYQEGSGRLLMMARTTSSGAPVAIDVHAAPVPAQEVPSDVAYSANKQHWIKVMTGGYGTSQAKQQISIDDKPAVAESYVGATKLAVSDDGKHYGFIGTRYGAAAGSLTHAFYDGKEGPSYNSIWDLALSPDGEHVAYVAQDGPGSTGDWYVVIDGVKGPPFVQVLPFTTYQEGDRRLLFAPDGSLHFYAYFGGQLQRCTYRAGAFKGLPSMMAVESDKPGLKVLHTLEGPGHTAIGLVMGADDTLYGVSIGEGRFKKGVLYQMKSDGSGYKVLHDFFGGDEDGEAPISLIIEPDGKLLGTLTQGKVFRYDPKTQQYGLVAVDKKNDYGPAFIVGETADGEVVGLGGGVGPQYRDLFSMKADGSGYTTVDNSQFSKPLRLYDQVIQAKDGSFFAVGGGSKGVLVKFKGVKDTPQVVHAFSNTPTEGSSPAADMVLDSKGNLYGTTNNGGMSQHGVIYRVDADGSNYKVIFNPDEFNFSKIIAAGDDGKVFGMTPEGLLEVDPGAEKVKVAMAFTGKADMNFQGLPKTIFHGGTMYAVTNKAIYRVPVAAPTGVAVAALPTVRVEEGKPGALAMGPVSFTEPGGTAAPARAGEMAGEAAPGPAGPAGGQQYQNQNSQPPPAAQQQQQQQQQQGAEQRLTQQQRRAQQRADDARRRAEDAARQLRGLFGQ
jgi:uncharacterized repeat protein (TIGR03803 family)